MALALRTTRQLDDAVGVGRVLLNQIRAAALLVIGIVESGRHGRPSSAKPSPPDSTREPCHTPGGTIT